MKLYIEDIEITSDSEIEMFSTNPFGLDAFVSFNDGTFEIRRNCTEIHSRYYLERNKIAFESDLHSQGGTVSIATIAMVKIIKSNELSECYCEVVDRSVTEMSDLKRASQSEIELIKQFN